MQSHVKRHVFKHKVEYSYLTSFAKKCHLTWFCTNPFNCQSTHLHIIGILKTHWLLPWRSNFRMAEFVDTILKKFYSLNNYRLYLSAIIIITITIMSFVCSSNNSRNYHLIVSVLFIKVKHYFSCVTHLSNKRNTQAKWQA